VALYIQPVRVYKEFLPSTPSRCVGPCGLHVFFEWTSSLVDTGYAKHEDPLGRVLVSSPRVSSRVVESGRDSNLALKS
jgi:hypothetical protein